MQITTLQHAMMHTKNLLTVMKKLILSAAALTMLLASCQKKDNAVATTTDGTSTNKSFKKAVNHVELYGNQNGKMRHYYDNGGNKPGDYGCDPTPENCAPEDVIINSANGISQLVMTIDRGDRLSGYVNSNRELLAQTIPTHYLDGVIDGSLSLSMRGDLDASYRCILFKDKTNAVALAVPVTK